MRLTKPRFASPEEVRITREGEYAIIEYADSSVMAVHLKIGPEIGKMTDQDILDLHNGIIRTREQMAAEYEHVAVEIPRGRPQIEYHPRADQWTPRGDVLRCVIEDGDQKKVRPFTSMIGSLHRTATFERVIINLLVTSPLQGMHIVTGAQKY